MSNGDLTSKMFQILLSALIDKIPKNILFLVIKIRRTLKIKR